MSKLGMSKIRAWDIRNKKMVYGISKMESIWDEELDFLLEDSMFPIGLFDKNKKEIYEDDICKMIILEGSEKYNPIEAFYIVIEWKNACWGFRHLYPELVNEDDREWRPFYSDEDNELWNLDYFEVVGNIHANQELLHETPL